MEGQLKKIKLLGACGRKFAREIEIAVQSPAEAVRALSVLFPDFRAWVLEQHTKGIAWRVCTDVQGGVKEEEMELMTSSEVIVFAPILQGRGGGGGGGGFWSVIVGVALVAFAFVAIPLGILAAGTGIATGIGFIGAGLILNGVSTMMTPTPNLTPSTVASSASPARSGAEAARGADLESNLFSRNQSTFGQGESVPVVYGQRLVRAPRVVSFDLRLLPKTRDPDTSRATGILGYVNNKNLSP